jgi:hypothetical protein
VRFALPLAATRMLPASVPTTSMGTVWMYEPFIPGCSPKARSCASMYADVSAPPRVAGARPSSRSDDR